MSLVLSLSSDVFFRRAEAAIKGTAGQACFDAGSLLDPLPDLLVVSPHSAEQTGFQQGPDGSIVLALRLRLTNGPFLEWTPLLLLTVGTRVSENDPQAFVLTLAFDELVFPPEIEPDLSDAANAVVAARLEPLLADLAMTVPLGTLLPSGAALDGAPRLRIPTPPDQVPNLTAVTLVVGVAVDADVGVDPEQFDSQFTGDPRGAHDWHVSVDSSLLRGRAGEVLAAIDLTDGDGSGIPNWLETTSTTVFWSGDDIPSGLPPWQVNHVNHHYPEHPLWFRVTGRYNSPAGVVPIWALGHADLVVGADGQGAPTFFVEPFLFAAGYGVLPLPIADDQQPGPRAVGSAAVTDDLRGSGTAFDADRLDVLGTDDHPGMPGVGVIQAPSEVRAVHDGDNGGLCGRIGVDVTSGTSLAGSDTVVKQFPLSNVGEAPLWICWARCDDPLFEVQHTPFLPFAIPPGDTAMLRVHYEAPDEEEHTATITVRSNAPQNTQAHIPVVGRLLTGGLPPSVNFDAAHTELLCMGMPELIPEQEWVNRLNDILGDPSRFVSGPVLADDRLEVTLLGLPVDALVQVLDARGAVLTTSRSHLGRHHMAVPASGAHALRISGSPSAGRSRLRAELTTSRILRLGAFEHRPPASEARLEGAVAYATFPDRIAVVDVRDPARPVETAGAEIADARWVGVVDRRLVARNRQGVHFFDVRDPYSPTPRRVIALPPNGRAQLADEHVALFADGALRLYSLSPDGSPLLRAELPAGTDAQLVPMSGRWAIGNERGGFSVDLRDRSREPATRPVGAERMRAALRNAEAAGELPPEHGRLRLRVGANGAAFELLETRYGVLGLRHEAIRERMSGRSEPASATVPDAPAGAPPPRGAPVAGA